MRREQQFQKLHPHPLARQGFEAGARNDAGVQSRGVGMVLAVPGVKAKKPQDTQIVFGDPRRRLADEAHAPRRDIGDAADIIENPAVGGDGQRIDGEIAPLGVGPPIPAEHDLGLAAIGLDVLPQRRNFERLAVDDDGDGAVVDTGGNRFPAGRLDAAHDLFRHRRRRDVDLVDCEA